MTQVKTISPTVWAEVETNLGSAAAESWLKEKNLKVEEDVKTAIANSTKEDTVTLSKQIDKQMGIGNKVKSAENSPLASTRVMGKDGNLTKSAKARIEKHPNAQKAIKEAKAYKAREAARKAAEAERINKLKAEKSVFSTPGIVRKKGKLTKKGVSMMTPNPNAKEAIKETKAYKAREAVRKIAEKSRLAKAREHFKALKERVQARINKSPFAQKGILAEGGELTKKGKAAMTTHSNAQAAIDGAKAYAEREAARREDGLKVLQQELII